MLGSGCILVAAEKRASAADVNRRKRPTWAAIRIVFTGNFKGLIA
jgi:hypothetical protein